MFSLSRKQFGSGSKYLPGCASADLWSVLVLTSIVLVVRAKYSDTNLELVVSTCI